MSKPRVTFFGGGGGGLAFLSFPAGGGSVNVAVALGLLQSGSAMSTRPSQSLSRLSSHTVSCISAGRHREMMAPLLFELSWRTTRPLVLSCHTPLTLLLLLSSA